MVPFHRISTLAVLLLLLIPLVGLPGCSRVRQEFSGDAEQVWTAMLAVAQSPSYEDEEDPDKRWTVKENHVAVFEDEARIEIYRELERVLHRAAARPWREERQWRFRVVLDWERDPMRATFTSRGWGVPTQAAAEGDRYFADVLDLLSGRVVPQDDAVDPDSAPSTIVPTPPAEPPRDPATDPIIDIDDL